MWHSSLGCGSLKSHNHTVSISSVGLIKSPESNYCCMTSKRKWLPRIIAVPPAYRRNTFPSPPKPHPTLQHSWMSAWANEDPWEVTALPVCIPDCRLSNRWAFTRVAHVLTFCSFSMGSRHLQAFLLLYLPFLKHAAVFEILSQGGAEGEIPFWGSTQLRKRCSCGTIRNIMGIQKLQIHQSLIFTVNFSCK